MNGAHCNALVTLLKEAVGLRDLFDSQRLHPAPTPAAFTVQIGSNRGKLCSPSSPPVTGHSSCCDINYRVFPYVPYMQGQGPSFTPVEARNPDPPHRYVPLNMALSFTRSAFSGELCAFALLHNALFATCKKPSRHKILLCV